MKKLTIILAFILASVTLVKADNKKMISLEKLPATAQTFIKTNFAKQNASIVNEQKTIFDCEYQVIFENGSKVEFDKNGNWSEVECPHGEVPNGIVPSQISSVVTKQFPKTKITKIEKDSRGYEVELSNDVELEFDSNHNLKKADK